MTKIFNKKRKPAFTLAEVLITLTIIGVIAAMVIPNLWQRHFEAEMVAKLKKNFSVLNNAYLQAIRENGNPDEWDIKEQNSGLHDGSEKLYNYIKPYLKIEKLCGQQSGCFAPEYKNLMGNDTGDGEKLVDSNRVIYDFILDDGTSVGVYTVNGCTAVQDKPYAKSCGTLYVDLNNKKGPNKYGWDMFKLIITDKNILPAGIGEIKLKLYQCVYNETNTYNGNMCAMHVLTKGNMDYLHKSIEKEWENYP